MDYLKLLFYFLIFPGFIFTITVGLLASWVDRKVTARIQWRVGPPWYQPFVDIIKLMSKETIIPVNSSKLTFLFSPIISLTAAILVSSIIWIIGMYPEVSFIGDLIVLVYLLIIPSLMLIVGGFASANPIASLGASREMKLILAYELPFIFAIIVPIIKAGNTINLGEIINYQKNFGAIISDWSGILAFLAIIFCMQAKLTLVPFDIPEAETEIIAGPFIEYSGLPLAFFKLTKASLLFVLPVFIITLFLGGIYLSGINLLWTILKYIGLLVIIILIRNTNPRLRIDQAIKFFWGPVTLLAIIAVILALFGL